MSSRRDHGAYLRTAPTDRLRIFADRPLARCHGRRALVAPGVADAAVGATSEEGERVVGVRVRSSGIAS